MKNIDMNRSWLATVATLGTGCALLAASGCAAEGDTAVGQTERTGMVHQAISSGWVDLVPLNGWQSYHGEDNPPQVGLANGVVTFRGALDGSAATSPIALELPIEFHAESSPALSMPVVMHNGSMGQLSIDNAYGFITIQQDDASTMPGPDARVFTSLDGVAFSQSVGDKVTAQGEWAQQYPYRQNDGSWANAVDATEGGSNPFVRFQGFLSKQTSTGDCTTAGLDGFLFTLPPALRTGQTIFVPTHLGLGTGVDNGSWGRLAIYSNGNVYVQGNLPEAVCGTSLEVSYSRTFTGNDPLELDNGWVAYSPRAPRVGLYDGVVRFQGAIKSGTSNVVGTLPEAMWPPYDVHLVAGAYGVVPATVVVSTEGVVSVENVPLSVASLMTSLDGVSYALPDPPEPGSPCASFCEDATVISWDETYQGGGLGSGAICLETTQEVAGGNCGNFAPGRELTVNGVEMPCNNQNWSSLPEKADGGYCIQTTEGDYPWAYVTLW